jgi:cytoskeletal protein RodZ
MGARIDVSEIEAQTKIRAKYLRALENEEWDLLPGPTFVRSFLRTYAQALGLDDKAIVDEYRLRYETPSEEHQPIVSSPRQAARRGSPGGGRPSRGYAIAVGAICLLIVLLLVGLLSKKGGGSAKKVGGTTTTAQSAPRTSTVTSSKHTPTAVAGERVSLSLQPSAAVYVCLIGDNGRKVIPGTILQPPYTPVTYHAKHFEITLGNNAVTMYVDGKPRSVPASAKAIGYTVTSAGRKTLAASKQPTCK